MRHTYSLSFALAAAALVPLGAHAVPYALPDGVYAQLQRTDTFATVCQSGEPCDVPAGTYTLLTFDTTPATRTTVTVGTGEPSRSAPRFELISARRFGTRELTVSCPSGLAALSGSCSAGAATDETLPPVFGSTAEASHTCYSVEEVYLIDAQVTCTDAVVSRTDRGEVR